MRFAVLALIFATSCRRPSWETPIVASDPRPETKPWGTVPADSNDEIDRSPLSSSPPRTGTARVVVGSHHACVLETDGRASCWGDNRNGALGDGTTVDHFSDLVHVDLLDIAWIGAGDDFTCALTRDRRVWCWGTGSHSVLPGDAPHTKPTAVAGLPRVRSLSVHYASACAASDDDVMCWGSSKLAPGDHPTVALTAMPTAMKLGGVAAIGSEHVGAVGVLRADGACEWHDAPRPVATLSSEATRGTSARVTAIRGSITARVWTLLDFGVVHFDELTSTGARHTSLATPPVLSLSNGVDPTCVVLRDGRVFCWGANFVGELGDGTTIARDTPAAVSGLTNAISVSGRLGHVCALTREREIWCWGRGYDGRVGAAARASLAPELFAKL